jgi:hypothetical protein
MEKRILAFKTLLLLLLLSILTLNIFLVACSGEVKTKTATQILTQQTQGETTNNTANQSLQITTNISTPTTTTITNSRPAVFTISDLYIDPQAIGSDDYFSIIFTVINSGGDGVYNAAMDIVNVAGTNRMEIGTLTKSVSVASGESKVVVFEKMHLPEGDYEATIDNTTLPFGVI